ncbi:hypothetical protein IFM89_002712 [Coptis chinensis]|uniref:Uncharacterized protein n=1 Tax=Coptis chinensis TaxID=261450 RepID=A0A835IKJ0_9MAGN|nr:hypothetical protein IFM89_002712 [Coptis chinensis]
MSAHIMYTLLLSRHVFATLSYIAETFIFLYVGMDALDSEKWLMSELSFGTSLGVYSTLIFLILLGRAVLVILGSAISSVFNKMYGSPRITYKDQVIIWWAGLMRGVVSIALAFSQAAVEEGSRSYGVMGILSLVGLVSFVVFFSLGIGASPWVIMSEILPINIKGLAGTFTIYTVVSAFTVVFVALWVPETKGKTLEEIQWSFR